MEVDIGKVYDSVEALKQGQEEFKETIQEMGFEQKQISKDVRALVGHVERQNGSISELEEQELRRQVKEDSREGWEAKQAGNMKWLVGLIVPASVGLTGIVVAAVVALL